MAFRGKCFAISGGASGIGRATARLLGHAFEACSMREWVSWDVRANQLDTRTLLWARGASLAVSDVNTGGLKTLKGSLLESNPGSENKQTLSTSVVDVTKSVEIDAWFSNVMKDFGKLDGAANVAGMSDGGGLLAQKTDADFDFSVNLNLRVVFNCMRAQLNNMQKGASIVNVSSGAGIRGIAGVSLYSAAKHGVNGLTRSAAREYGPMGIRINSVCPGLIHTPALEEPVARQFVEPQIKQTPLGRWGEPEEIAKVIAFLLSEESSYQSGAVIPIDGGNFA